MENFDLMSEVCGKIAAVATEIGRMDIAISSFQDKGYKKSAELYVDMQLKELDQLHNLVLFLTGLLIPEPVKKQDEGSDEEQESESSNEEPDEEDFDFPPNDEAKRRGELAFQQIHEKMNRNDYGKQTNRYSNRIVQAKPVSRKAGSINGKRK